MAFFAGSRLFSFFDDQDDSRLELFCFLCPSVTLPAFLSFVWSTLSSRRRADNNNKKKIAFCPTAKENQEDMEPFFKRQRRSLSGSATTTTKVGNSWGPTEENRENGATRLWLDKEKTSWVDVLFLRPCLVPDKEGFQKLWDLHPSERGKVRMLGKVHSVPRYQQSYGRPYNFSGMLHDALPVPEEILPWLDHANGQKHYSRMYGKDHRFNEVLINWYQDGNHHIGAHSDDERQLNKSEKGETIVYSITFQDGGLSRRLRLKPKVRRKDGKPNMDRLDITLSDGLLLVMGGLCQRTHKHQVPKETKDATAYGRRVNLTFRCFK